MLISFQIGGNSCQVSRNNCPPRDVPLETKVTEFELKPGQKKRSSIIQKPGHKKKRLAIFGTLISCVVFACCMVSYRATAQPAAAQPVTLAAQPAAAQPAPIGAQQLAQPGVFRPKYTPRKKKTIDDERFELLSLEMTMDGKHYSAETESTLKTLALPDEQKVKPRRRLSFVNEHGEIEDGVDDGND
jgi:hypothetical protein